jgi:hypothetical protein
MTTKAQLVAATECGLMTALGRRSRVAVAHQTEQILAEAAGATRRLRMFGPG